LDGADPEDRFSWGFGGTATKSHAGNFEKFGQTFGKDGEKHRAKPLGDPSKHHKTWAKQSHGST